MRAEEREKEIDSASLSQYTTLLSQFPLSLRFLFLTLSFHPSTESLSVSTPFDTRDLYRGSNDDGGIELE